MTDQTSMGSSVQSVKDIGRTCLDAKISILPVRADGTKKSAVYWRWLQRERMLLENFQQVFRPGFGLAVIGGKVSGHLEILDFDRWETWLTFHEAATAAGLSDLLARLLEGYFERTPNGAHLLYRCPTLRIPGDTALARTVERDDSGNVILDEQGNQKMGLLPIEWVKKLG
jgi:hypothetical protein